MRHRVFGRISNSPANLESVLVIANDVAVEPDDEVNDDKVEFIWAGKKKARLPMTGGNIVAKQAPTAKPPATPNWVLWKIENKNGHPKRYWIPGFLMSMATAGYVPEGSPEELAMKAGLVAVAGFNG